VIWKSIGKLAEVPLPIFLATALRSTSSPVVAEDGIDRSCAVRSGSAALTVRLLLQGMVAVWVPDVMATVAVFPPGDEYALVTDCVVPERPSVPLHE
jgi:hypothetical protein